jgi:hypothetical protein
MDDQISRRGKWIARVEIFKGKYAGTGRLERSAI